MIAFAKSVLFCNIAVLLSSAAVAAEDGDAFAVDDHCDASTEACSLNMLQTRGVVTRNAHSAETLSATPTRSSGVVGHDISEEVAQKLMGYIGGINENVTLLEWRIYYMNMDLQSTNGSLRHIPNHTVGVNGTVVDWNAHDARWIPTFSLLEDSETSQGSDEQPALSSLLERSSDGRRRTSSSLAGIPPLTQKCQRYMLYEQEMLDKIERQVADLERNMHTLDHYMARNSPALLQEDVAGRAAAEEVFAEIRERSSERRRRTSVKEVGLHQPEEAEKLLMAQIERAWNQTDGIFDKLVEVGTYLQNLKRRVDEFGSSLAEVSVGSVEDELAIDEGDVSLIAERSGESSAKDEQAAAQSTPSAAAPGAPTRLRRQSQASRFDTTDLQ